MWVWRRRLYCRASVPLASLFCVPFLLRRKTVRWLSCCCCGWSAGGAAVARSSWLVIIIRNSESRGERSPSHFNPLKRYYVTDYDTSHHIALFVALPLFLSVSVLPNRWLSVCLCRINWEPLYWVVVEIKVAVENNLHSVHGNFHQLKRIFVINFVQSDRLAILYILFAPLSNPICLFAVVQPIITRMTQEAIWNTIPFTADINLIY